jgi:hypothetical protein
MLREADFVAGCLCYLFVVVVGNFYSSLTSSLTSS